MFKCGSSPIEALNRQEREKQLDVRGVGLLRTRRQRLERCRPEELQNLNVRPTTGHQQKRLTGTNSERSLTLG